MKILVRPPRRFVRPDRLRRHRGVLRLARRQGTVTLTIYKAGWIIGGSGGGGSLHFRGRNYPLSAGGLDYGLVFGGSKTVLRGRVSNIFRPPMSPASMARPAPASRSAAAPAPSC